MLVRRFDPKRVFVAGIVPALLFILLIAPGTVAAQTAGGSPANDAKEVKSPLEIGPSGYSLKASDGVYGLKIGGLIQLDGRFFLKDSNPALVDAFYLRRVIPTLQGNLGSGVSFQISPDFGQSNATLSDAFAEVKFLNWVRLRFGKFRSPIGLERLQPPAQLAFPEFSLATQLTPVRDVGIQVGGEASNGGAGYALGIFNGSRDNGQNDVDVAGPKEAAGKLFVRPLKLANVKFDGELLVGIAGTYGKVTPPPDAKSPGAARGSADTLPNFTTAGGQPWASSSKVVGTSLGAFTTASSTQDQNSNTVVNGHRKRLNAHLYAVVGPASLLAEYLRADERFVQGWIGTSIVNAGWNATATVFLFGGKPGFNPVKIASGFDPSKGQFGALELAAKVSTLKLDSKLFAVLDPTSAGKTLADPSLIPRQATEFEGGLNYYYSSNIRFLFDYAQTRFKGGAGTRAAVTDRQTEHLLTGRTQINF